MTPAELRHHLTEAAVVPILMATDPSAEAALALSDHLVEAGATTIEVLFRLPRAPEALAGIRKRHPRLILAAGTVLDAAGVATAQQAGADLLISPGLSPGLLRAVQEAGALLVPGVNTASEVQSARELGYLTQKFYPAFDFGEKRLKEFGSIYADVAFLVTGGLGSANLPAFAAHTNVAALGGTWMLGSPEAAAALADDLAAVRAARKG